MNQELKPCPFCNGAARIESSSLWHDLVCDHDRTCVLDGDTAEMSYLAADPTSVARMVEKWNRRALPAPAASEAPSRDPEALLEIARFTGLRHWLHGVNATSARELLAAFVAELDRRAASNSVEFDSVAQAGAGGDDAPQAAELPAAVRVRDMSEARRLITQLRGALDSANAQLALRQPQGADNLPVLRELVACCRSTSKSAMVRTGVDLYSNHTKAADAGQALIDELVAAKQAGKEGA